MTGIEDCLHE